MKRWINQGHHKVNYYHYSHDRLLCGKKAPKNLGCLEDLYALENIGEDSKHILENNHYKLLDDKAAKILNKLALCGAISLNDIEKISWCDFIISMMTRNPVQIQKSINDGKPGLDRGSDHHHIMQPSE